MNDGNEGSGAGMMETDARDGTRASVDTVVPSVHVPAPQTRAERGAEAKGQCRGNTSWFGGSLGGACEPSLRLVFA